MTARDVVLPHFPDLTADQLGQLDAIASTVWDWNQRINVISRKDPAVMERHVLHSLGIAKVMRFEPGTPFSTWEPAEGFLVCPWPCAPGSGLCALRQHRQKIKVVQAAANAAGLTNVWAIHARAEDVEGTYDFVVSRAVTRMAGFLGWVDGKIGNAQRNGLPNGVLYLKGGDLRAELSEVAHPCTVTPLKTWYKDPFFDSKHVVHVALPPGGRQGD